MCAMVASASGDSFSFPHSSRVIAPLVRWLFPSISPEALHWVIVVVRKGAHVTEYALLTMLVWRALAGSYPSIQTGWNWRWAAISVGFVALYATGDELHQALVPSRQGSAWDVALDTLGGVLGLAIIWGWGKVRRRW